ncbi:ABC transporter ATP-binding protein [Cobetia amphilecti]|uniref:ABC transporter ATP-binding protein n=1 Tax=Cobetia amphilecti TaxID=1055104 RepID=UPI002942F540|nr:ABC transporter ATP-binding protein [Cobetia amphilecti]WOI24904.1 ABC transporter ATP-binding protein [Cobetia amphilecti]|tara:strand:+ start:3620 stop:4729 length:1110 start_codon:yes stop_codon:yes gene_type:complete
MIEIKNLYKRYHNHHGSDWVLRNINLTIPSGVSVGLIGANGAGKSTLLRLIAGMDTPERGEVIRHSRVSWPIGLSGGMQSSMTGRQNVKFVARAQGRAKDVAKIVDFVEDFAEIGAAFDEPVRTYSSGMRSRLSFGLSFAFDFDVYISDEATAVGDRAFKAKAQQLFQRRIGQASLIMVSHGERILHELCEAGIYLVNGKALWFSDIKDAILAYHSDIDKINNSPGKTSKKVTVHHSEKNDLEKLIEQQKIMNQKLLKHDGLLQAYLSLKRSGITDKESNRLEKILRDWWEEYKAAQLEYNKIALTCNVLDKARYNQEKNRLNASLAGLNKLKERQTTMTLYDEDTLISIDKAIDVITNKKSLLQLQGS